jgi:hypothetical protein
MNEYELIERLSAGFERQAHEIYKERNNATEPEKRFVLDVRSKVLYAIGNGFLIPDGPAGGDALSRLSDSFEERAGALYGTWQRHMPKEEPNKDSQAREIVSKIMYDIAASLRKARRGERNPHWAPLTPSESATHPR